MRFIENIGGKLQSLEEWLQIVNQFKSLHHRCETNCYIPLLQMEEYIKNTSVQKLTYTLEDRKGWETDGTICGYLMHRRE